VEFPAGGRYLDILALDSKGAFVVIELKVSGGYDRTMGQQLGQPSGISPIRTVEDFSPLGRRAKLDSNLRTNAMSILDSHAQIESARNLIRSPPWARLELLATRWML